MAKIGTMSAITCVQPGPGISDTLHSSCMSEKQVRFVQVAYLPSVTTIWNGGSFVTPSSKWLSSVWPSTFRSVSTSPSSQRILSSDRTPRWDSHS